MEANGARSLVFDLDGTTRAGAFVTLDRSGQLSVCRGYVQPEDEPCAEITANDDCDPGAVKIGQRADVGVCVSDMVWAFPPEG